MSRHIAREVAFKVAFEMEFQDESAEELFDRFLEYSAEKKLDINDEDVLYIKDVITGVKNNLENIDNCIKSKLKDWNFDRISKIDLGILRVAIYEILYRNDIPEKVSVNEAVEICKTYGEDSSPSFVNGVLAEVLKEKKA